MQKKRNIASWAIALGFLSLSSTSLYSHDFTDLAPVIKSRPILERINAPREECWQESNQTSEVVVERERRGERSYGGAVIGGIAGGLLGNQVGKGNGNTAATAAGAVVGAIVGDNLDNRDHHEEVRTRRPVTRTVERCRTVDNYREEVRGYDVTYRYNGRDVTVRMNREPGSHVRVGIGVLDESTRDSRY